MNLLSQIVKRQCDKFLKETKGKQGASSSLIQSKLGIMQNAQTFVSLYKLLKLIEETYAKVSERYDQVKGF